MCCLVEVFLMSCDYRLMYYFYPCKTPGGKCGPMGLVLYD